jgi:hypothetical protein
MRKFNMENSFQQFPERLELDENKMSRDLKLITRLTFMAGANEILLQYLSLAEMEEDDAIKKLDDIIRQVGEFPHSFDNNTSTL